MASSSNNVWTWAQNKLFEGALVKYDEDTPDRWENIAKITGKTVEEVKIHYKKLMDDLDAIEAGKLIPLPEYAKNEAKGCTDQQDKKK